MQLDEQDYEVQDDDNPFVILQPQSSINQHSTRKHTKTQSNNRSPYTNPILKSIWKQLQAQCLTLQEELIKARLDQKIRLVQENLSDGYNGDKSVLLPIHVKRNQLQDLKVFTTRLKEVIEKREVFHFRQNLDPVLLYIETHTELRGIMLDMYLAIDSSLIQDKNEQVITLVKKVSDLNQKNLYLLAKGLRGKRFVLVIPTFCNLQQQSFDQALAIEIDINYNSLYDAKDLFCEYMYRCMLSPKIKCYLPRQATELLSDYDFYPISFREGVRRLMFLMEQHLFLTGKENSFVEFSPYTDVILDSVLQLHSYYKKQVLYERMIRSIVWTCPSKGEKDAERNKFGIFTVPSAVISSRINFVQQTSKKSFSEEEVIQELRQQLIRRYEGKLISTDQQKHKGSKSGHLDNNFCLNVLKGATEERRINEKKSKKDRATLLGITDASFKSAKNILQDQMTQIIRQFTVNVRKQGNSIKEWDQYLFQRRIRPQLPRQIVNNLCMRFTDKHAAVAEVVRASYIINLSDIVSETAHQKWQDGELLYIIRDLEIFGLIDRNRKLSQLSYTNNFYQKTKYRTR